MIVYLAEIGAFAIIVVLFFLFLYQLQRSDEKRRNEEDLMRYVDDKDIINYPNGSWYMTIKKTLENKTVRERTELKRKEAKEYEKKSKERDLKNKITLRVNAYPYEDMLFELYAPFCEVISDKWTLLFHKGLSKYEVIKEIQRIKGVSKEEAVIVFDELVTKSLIDYSHLNQKYELSYVLRHYPNVLSDEDMNIHKWILSHGGTNNYNPFIVRTYTNHRSLAQFLNNRNEDIEFMKAPDGQFFCILSNTKERIEVDQETQNWIIDNGLGKLPDYQVVDIPDRNNKGNVRTLITRRQEHIIGSLIR